MKVFLFYFDVGKSFLPHVSSVYSLCYSVLSLSDVLTEGVVEYSASVVSAKSFRA